MSRFTRFEYSHVVVEAAAPRAPPSHAGIGGRGGDDDKNATVIIAPCDGATVSFNVTNVGGVNGAEIAQLYLSSAYGAPNPELKAFAKVGPLSPGASARVTLVLSATELATVRASDFALSVKPEALRLFVGGAQPPPARSASSTLEASLTVAGAERLLAEC